MEASLKKLNSLNGFVLLEMTIALCVLGGLTSIVFPLIRSVLISKKEALTQAHIAATLKALSIFHKNHHRLPFAGNHGIEKENTWIGQVPYQTLFLPQKMACDCSGEVLYYIVNPCLTAQDSESSQEDDDVEKTLCQNSLLLVTDEDGDSLLPDHDTTDVCAVILISPSDIKRFQPNKQNKKARKIFFSKRRKPFTPTQSIRQKHKTHQMIFSRKWDCTELLQGLVRKERDRIIATLPSDLPQYAAQWISLNNLIYLCR